MFRYQKRDIFNEYMESTSLVYIIIVNWNGWADTIECLESIFRSDYANYRVIVCDNDSQDGSVEYIKCWAEGLLDVWVNSDNQLRQFSYPPTPKPIAYQECTRSTLDNKYNLTDSNLQLTLVHTESNLGFGKANNIGIKYAFNHGADFVWLVNNDTIISKNAITEMVRLSKNRPGVIGSILKYYHQPDEIQAYGGGYFSSFTGLLKHEQKSMPISLNFITGASMMINRSTFDILGGFDEKIFMYFEDIDYCIRANKNNINIACSNAIVFHKVGKSSGGENSYFACFNAYKNKFYSLNKNYGFGLWVLVYISSLVINIINPNTSMSKKQACYQNLLLLFHKNQK